MKVSCVGLSQRAARQNSSIFSMVVSATHMRVSAPP
jgi:hypothetical protein